MNILKRRVNGTSIVILGDKMYTRSDVDDALWVNIMEQIDTVNSCIEDSDELSAEVDKLLMLIDPDRVKKMKKRAETIQKNISDGLIEKDLSDRVRKAKRIVDISGIFEYDEDGMVFLKGFDHVMPKIMVDAILDAYYNPSSQYTVNSLLNFWKYLLLNPDKAVRNDLFKWIRSGKFVITEDGNIVSYRNVNVKKDGSNQKLIDFVSESWGKIKRWKKSPKNYVVISNKERDTFELFESSKANVTGTDNISLGNLDILMDTLVYSEGSTIYKPEHSGPYGQEIVIGTEVSMPRNECDNNPESTCSRGLHQKSPSYGMYFGNKTLTCLTNPYNVVAIPNEGNFSKFRCCAYMPVCKTEVNSGNIVEFSPGTYDIPYNGIGLLENLLASRSIVELKKSGDLSDEISEDDFSAIMETAKQVVSKRVIRGQYV